MLHFTLQLQLLTPLQHLFSCQTNLFLCKLIFNDLNKLLTFSPVIGSLLKFTFLLKYLQSQQYSIYYNLHQWEAKSCPCAKSCPLAKIFGHLRKQEIFTLIAYIKTNFHISAVDNTANGKAHVQVNPQIRPCNQGSR